MQKSFGAEVTAVDINERRLELSRHFGAVNLVNPGKCDVFAEIMEITRGKGFDKVIECSGNPNAIRMAIGSLKLRGRLVQVGVCPRLEIDTFEHLIKNEIEIIGSRNFNNYELDEVIEFVRKNPEINDVITHRFSMDEAQAAYEMAKKVEGLKILIKPDNQ